MKKNFPKLTKRLELKLKAEQKRFELRWYHVYTVVSYWLCRECCILLDSHI